MAPTWNDEFKFPDSASDIQDHIEYSIKKSETLTPAIRSIHVSINRINNRLVFKIKDLKTVFKNLELQTPETMQLFGRTQKKLIDKINRQVSKQC